MTHKFDIPAYFSIFFYALSTLLVVVIKLPDSIAPIYVFINYGFLILIVIFVILGKIHNDENEN